MFYLMTHSTHFIKQLYGRHMVNDHSERVRGNPLPPHGLLFQNSSKGSYMHHPIDRITYHGLCYTSRGALVGTRNSSMGAPHEGSIRRLTNTAVFHQISYGSLCMLVIRSGQSV